VAITAAAFASPRLFSGLWLGRRHVTEALGKSPRVFLLGEAEHHNVAVVAKAFKIARAFGMFLFCIIARPTNLRISS
jgi:hypothetical protein